MDILGHDDDLLYGLAHDCEALFDAQLARIGEPHPPLASLIAEYQQRFAIWTDYLGVFARRSQCLDARLRNQPDVQDLVARLLDILRRSLQQLVRCDEISGESHATQIGDDMHNKVGNSHHEAVAAIEEALTRLNKLGVTIRRSSRDRIDIKVKKFATSLDLAPFAAASQAVLQTLYPDTHQALREYLSKTMTDRYAAMLFSKHRGMLLKSRRPKASFTPMPTIGEGVGAATPCRDSANGESGGILNPAGLSRTLGGGPQSDLSTVNSVLLRQVLSSSRNFEGPDVRRRGTSSVQVSQANYPPQPFQKDSNFISCEFCTRAIDKRNTTEQDWRRHVDEDLKPYTCISEVCPDGHPAYPTFSEWLEHMTERHGGRWHQRVFLTSGWVCAICDDGDADGPYSSPDTLLHHLTQAHGDRFSASRLHAISRQSRVEQPRRWNECLLCCFSVEDVKATDKTLPPKRQKEQLRRGCDKAPRRTFQARSPGSVVEESSAENSGVPSDDSLSGSDETATSGSAETMARHIAAHLQVVMLLTIRLAFLHDEQMDVGDDVNSESVDIGDSDGPSLEMSARKTEDSGSPTDLDMPDANDQESQVTHMLQDDSHIPDVDVDFGQVRRRYDGLSVDQDEFIQDLISSGAFRRREPLPPASRRGFRSVREVGGACRTCHYKKSRCRTNPSNPNGACLGCVKPRLCYRYSVTEVSLYRELETPFLLHSQRWMTMDLVDIEDWASDMTLTITVSQTFVEAPYELTVRKFIPRDGDMLEATWYVDGKRRQFAVPPYAIVNVAEAVDAISDMVTYRQHLYLDAFLPRQSEDCGGDFLWQTYHFAFGYGAQVQDETVKMLIQHTFRLWVACRLTSYPDAIVGEEKLGMPQAVTDPSSPWANRYPTPPVMCAQLECIIYTELLLPLGQSVRRLLDDLFKKRGRDHWLAAYLIMFMLLHNCAMLTKRDEIYARQVNLGTKYANPEAVKKLQEGAITLLAHFHGVVGGPTPFCHGLYKNWGCFTLEQEAFIEKTYLRTNIMGEFLRGVRESYDPSNEWYWISQLYDEDWSPDKTIPTPTSGSRDSREGRSTKPKDALTDKFERANAKAALQAQAQDEGRSTKPKDALTDKIERANAKAALQAQAQAQEGEGNIYVKE